MAWDIERTVVHEHHKALNRRVPPRPSLSSSLVVSHLAVVDAPGDRNHLISAGKAVLVTVAHARAADQDRHLLRFLGGAAVRGPRGRSQGHPSSGQSERDEDDNRGGSPHSLSVTDFRLTRRRDLQGSHVAGRRQ